MAVVSTLVDEREPLMVALRLANAQFVLVQRNRLLDAGVVQAVADRDPAPLFDWLVWHFAMQGISDRAAISYQSDHGQITWSDVTADLERAASCPRLQSWWHFECGYRKASRTCAEPAWLASCGLPKYDLRKGVLNEAAFGLALFVRDVCGGDLVGWIDHRLEIADNRVHPFASGRRMAMALVGMLSNIPGTGPKLWGMLLADLLLAANPERERWVAAGASMIAVDSLVHAWLHRTGMARQHGVMHPYGSGCYGARGCAEVIEKIAASIDVRAFNPTFPAFFPRFVQLAIWEFCAEQGRNICNGRKIDDRRRCGQIFCPAGPGCARLALHE